MAHTDETELQQFAHSHQLDGLSDIALDAIAHHQQGYTETRGHQFLNFHFRINRELLSHQVITDNHYAAWFSQGEISEEQLKAFIVQFSVFSNQFLIAQLQKTINADTLEGMRASKEILANEIGVVFRRLSQIPQQPDVEIDPQLVSTQGTIEGGTFHFRASHFEWLLQLAEKLQLQFADLGKRHHGTDSTLFFCDELARLYGSENYMTSQACSYAVENWAAAGFWKRLITGFKIYNQKNDTDLPLAFFIWHDKLEDQHAQHTQEELEELYFSRNIDEDRFIRDGNEMLEGVTAFWHGLESQRKML